MNSRLKSPFFRLSALGFFLVIVGVVGYLAFGRKPPRVDMARYVPADAILFAEIGDVPDTVTRLTETDFWRGLRPAIGFPDQLLYLGTGAGVIGQLDLGPDEARLLGRAQWSVVVTGVATEGKPVVTPPKPAAPVPPADGKKNAPPNAKTGAKTEAEPEGTLGVELSVKPRLAVVIKTNLSADRVTALVSARLPLLARKLLGTEAVREESNYQQIPVVRFRAPGGSKALVSAAVGDILIVGNDEPTLNACLDTIAGRRPALAAAPVLAPARAAVNADTAALFAFINPTGLAQLGQFGFGILPESIASNPAAQTLVESAVKGMTDGLSYSASIENGRVCDRYHLSLHAEASAALRPHAGTLAHPPRALELVPGDGIATCSVMAVQHPFEATEKVQQAISARSNIAVAFLMREVFNALRARYGLGPRDTLDDALGQEIAHVTFANRDSVWMVEVRDRVRVLPVLDRYLRAENATISNESINGVDLVVSSNPDGRAAGFLGDFLVVGPKDTVKAIILSRGKPVAGVISVLREKQGTDAAVFSISVKSDREELEALTLGIAKAAHAGDATPERLRDPKVRAFLDAQPPAVGKTELRPDGLYSETRSAAGNFALFAALIGPDEPVTPKASS